MKKVTQAVGNRRLLALATFLRGVPRKRFDYSHWVGEGWKGAQDLSCGTTACALGWAATMPQFQRLGLRLRLRGYWANSPVIGSGSSRGPTGSAALLFGLTYNEASVLFSPASGEDGATPKQVAKKIERFVAQRVREVPALATQEAKP